MADGFELEAADVYTLACFAVGQDGTLEPDEEALLERIREGLGLAPARAAALQAKAFATPRALDAEPAPFDRLALFAQVARLAWIDEELSPAEQALLRRLARLLGLREDEAAASLGRARALMVEPL